jgi:hypothetical protein
MKNKGIIEQINKASTTTYKPIDFNNPQEVKKVKEKIVKFFKEDTLHQEIRDWIELNEFPPVSLDELIHEDMFGMPFMNLQQKEEASEFMRRFLEL